MHGDLRKPKLYGNHFHIQHLLLRKRKQSQMRDLTGRGVFLSALECYILSDWYELSSQMKIWKFWHKDWRTQQAEEIINKNKLQIP